MGVESCRTILLVIFISGQTLSRHRIETRGDNSFHSPRLIDLHKAKQDRDEILLKYRAGQGVADTEKTPRIHTAFSPFEFFMLPYSFLSVGM